MLGVGFGSGGHGGGGCDFGGLTNVSTYSVVLAWTGFCYTVLSEVLSSVSVQVIAIGPGGQLHVLARAGVINGPCSYHLCLSIVLLTH